MNTSKNIQEPQGNDANRVLGTVISNEEICRRKCLDCGYDGGDLAQDSCYKCGHRYTPTEENENCPKCGDEEYDSHCPICDSNQIPYWDEYQEMLKDGTIS